MNSIITVLAVLITATFAQGATPFTPTAGVTVELNDRACVMIDGDVFLPQPEIDFFTQECVGFGGWRVIHHGGDARSYVRFMNGKTQFSVDQAIQSLGHFPNVGGKVEFRVQRVQGKSATVTSALVAFSAQDVDDYQKSHFRVAIVKLSTVNSCVIAQIEATSETDEIAWAKARTEADAKASKANCK